MMRTISMSAVLLAATTLYALAPGDTPPAVKARNQDAKTMDLAELYGQRPVVLFFYPKSFTPGCTIEVQAFRDAAPDLKAFDAAVFGVSRDEQRTQRKFCDAYRLAYDLLADEDGALGKAFGIASAGSVHARQTVVIGHGGKVVLIDPDVNKDIKGHPKKLVAALEKEWADYKSSFKPLFNGKNLDGWLPVQAAADTWTVKDGTLQCSGKPTGYIRTNETHKDYRLLVEFKYTERLGNAGLLVHINGPDKVWPKSIEPNLNIGQMGKFYLIDGASVEFAGDNPLRNVDVKVGQWCRYEIICQGDTIRALLNGELVNDAKKANPSAGFVGVQSEGVPIHFHTIGIKSVEATKRRRVRSGSGVQDWGFGI